MNLPIAWFLTCEHAGNQIPKEYKELFTGSEFILDTHRGIDIGSMELIRLLRPLADVQPHVTTVSRLLIDCNRSQDSTSLFSEFSDILTEERKTEVIRQFYTLYRDRVHHTIQELLESVGSVIHLSVHTFTPILNDEERTTDIGILFDPDRIFEVNFAEKWMKELKMLKPEMIFHFNRPYLGTDDGFTTFLRQKFPNEKYAGIEIEVNQKYMRNPESMEEISHVLFRSLQNVKRDIGKQL